MSLAIAIDLCGLPKITDFCCNFFEVLHLYKLPYFIQYKVRGGAFDLAVEVTQMYIHVLSMHRELQERLLMPLSKALGHGMSRTLCLLFSHW